MRPISVEIVPSHVHLSDADATLLFGAAHVGTIRQALSQTGQYAYEHTVTVRGKLKRGMTLRVLGPSRRETQVELTPTEAELLGIKATGARSGDLGRAEGCTLTGAQGSVLCDAAVIIPTPHLHLSDADADAFRVHHGDIVALDILGDAPCVLKDVVVRVHPTYTLRLYIHPDIARDLWITGSVHARIRDAR